MFDLKLLALCLDMIEDESDKQKFETMFYEYKALMFRYARKHLRNEQDAEDAVSIAFQKAAQNIHVFDEAISEHTRNTLINIVVKSSIDLYRKQKRHMENTVPLQDWDHIKYEPNTDSALILADALERLSEEQKRIILLRYREKYTNREIAALLGYTVTKVDQIVSRTRKQLKRILEDVQYET